MAWKRIDRDLDVAPAREQPATANALNVSLGTLRRYLAGQASYRDVLEALRHIEYVGGQPVRRATAHFSRCLTCDNETARYDAAIESLAEIGAWINRHRAA